MRDSSLPESLSSVPSRIWTTGCRLLCPACRALTLSPLHSFLKIRLSNRETLSCIQGNCQSRWRWRAGFWENHYSDLSCFHIMSKHVHFCCKYKPLYWKKKCMSPFKLFISIIYLFTYLKSLCSQSEKAPLVTMETVVDMSFDDGLK